MNDLPPGDQGIGTSTVVKSRLECDAIGMQLLRALVSGHDLV